jgi:hypothetical protein
MLISWVNPIGFNGCEAAVEAGPNLLGLLLGSIQTFANRDNACCEGASWTTAQIAIFFASPQVFA